MVAPAIRFGSNLGRIKIYRQIELITHSMVTKCNYGGKSISSDGLIIFKYGDGNGDLLYKLYCIENEEIVDSTVPTALFYGDSLLPNPSITDIEDVATAGCCDMCDVVVCSVKKYCLDQNCQRPAYNIDRCFWKI